MSRIIRLQSENVKRLRAVDITPTGNVVIIGGRNGQGKSSVLDSIAMALGGADEAPDLPIRVGEEKAQVILDLEDIIIKRTFTASGTVLVVENKDGARYPKPQDLLNRLTGKLTFDPLEFIRVKPDEQMVALKRIVGLDFTAIEGRRKALYDERTLVNRDATSAKARAEFMPQHADAPAEEQSVTDIVAERDAAKDHNAKEKTLRSNVDADEDCLRDAHQGSQSIAGEIESLESRLSNLRAQLKEYDATIPEIEKRLSASKDAVAAFVPKDISPINLRMAGVEVANKKVRENKARVAAMKDADAVAAKADALTKQIEAIDKDKEAQLAAAKFPVEGLSFNEGGVLFAGVPFSQASKAEQLRVSLAMAAALNPKLPVMLIRDGSLLDDDSLALVTAFAAERNLQVWIERVGDGDPSAVIIEDGSVVTAPEEAFAPLATD